MCVYKICLLTFFLALSSTIQAEQFLVTQKNLKFSTPIQVVKPGDSVLFKNLDNVTHNIVSAQGPTTFNFDAFKPGMSQTVDFNAVGVVDVKCTIHSGMKMTIFVWGRN